MRRTLKWIVRGVAGTLGLLAVVVAVMYLIGGSRIQRTYTAETASLMLPTDSASLARGAHLTRIHGCTDCHGANLGGQVFLDIPPFRATAANLTAGRGGIGGRYSAQDLDRAIRHGIKPDGRSVIIMPSAAFHQMSDGDAASLIAYLKTVPPVDNELPPTEIRAPGRIMAAAVLDPTMEVRTGRTRGTTPAVGPTREYGEYLTSMTCAYCHGDSLRGNDTPPIPGSPPAPDLTSIAQRWPIGQFKKTLRTGITPDGRHLDAEFMPYTLTAAMQEAELEAIHAYLTSLSAPTDAGS